MRISFHPWHPSGHQSFSRSGQRGWTSVALQILYTTLLLWFLVDRLSTHQTRSTLTFSFLASILIAFSDQSSERASGLSALLLLSIMLSSGNLLTRCFVAAMRKDLAPRTKFLFFSSENFPISLRVCSPIPSSLCAKWFSKTSKLSFENSLDPCFYSLFPRNLNHLLREPIVWRY